MWLFILLLIPTTILIIGLIFGRGKITFKEFLVEEAVMILLMVGGYFIARHQSVQDCEIWNGWLVRAEYYEEWWERVSCRHPIPCSHDDKDGDPIHSDDGHYHLYDVDYHSPYWTATTSNNEVTGVSRGYFERAVQMFGNQEYVHIFRSSKDRGPGNKYVATYIAGSSEMIPTAIEHNFVNYIKADPYTVLRRVGQTERFQNLLPDYPRTNSQLEVNRVLALGVSVPALAEWNRGIALINARLGARKQVNAILVIVNTDDSAYLHTLEAHWLGGKKNDFVIIIGCTQYPEIRWVRIMSWSRSEDLKVELRDAIQDIGTLEKRDEILQTIETMVAQKFVRTPMADFEYLMRGWQPSFGVLLVLVIVGVGVSVGLAVLFIRQDPFGARGPYC